MIRVMLVDDHAVVRMGFRMLLATAQMPPGGHHGLRWLAERAEGLGGSFRIAARAPRGVLLEVRLPLQAPAAAEAAPALQERAA